MYRSTITLFFFLFFGPAVSSAAVIHVPGDQSTIQDGINAASSGDTVLVADGTYGGYGNTNLNFYGKTITVKSANGPQACLIDCGHQGRGFYFHSGEGENSVVDGFKIINGNMSSGGAIYCSSLSSPTITNNMLVGNTADNGSAIFCMNASPKIIRNIISGNAANWGGGIYCNYASPTIMHNEISFNSADEQGGGIICRNSSAPLIGDNTITGNDALRYGGAISCLENSSARITQNTISGNLVNYYDGGGIYADSSLVVITKNTISGNIAGDDGGAIGSNSNASLTINNNVISGNTANDDGGGIYAQYSPSTITNNLISGNHAGDRGGGIRYYYYTHNAANNTITGNTSGGNRGGGICSYQATSAITNSIFWFNSPNTIYTDSGSHPSVTYSDVQGGYSGVGNINSTPLFATGPLGQYYLSQIASGQASNSPCVNAGNPASTMIPGTTRTDGVQDSGIIDMGYHYQMMAKLITGAGPAYANPPHVRIFPPEQDAIHEFEFGAYGTPHFGVNVTCGDVTGDDLDEIITGPGPGAVFGPHVRGFQTNGTPVHGLGFMAYSTRKFGVNVATGDLDGDGFDEIITGAGPGAVFGPHVRAFNYDNTATVTPMPGVSFMAYGIRLWGVNVAGGDIDSDGIDEIVTGPGPGAVFGPHVRGWNVDGGPARPINQVSFLAYGTRKYGCVVTCGDADGDGIDEIITAPGPAKMFAAHIGGWNYDGITVSPLPGYSFFAWPSSDVRYGGRVFAGADLEGDGTDELVAGAGPDPSVGSPVKVFRYEGFGIIELFSLQAFPSTWTHGVNVAAGSF